jgi:hypothetical protein
VCADEDEVKADDDEEEFGQRRVKKNQDPLAVPELVQALHQRTRAATTAPRRGSGDCDE